jgi:hypothetical protein
MPRRSKHCSSSSRDDECETKCERGKRGCPGPIGPQGPPGPGNLGVGLSTTAAVTLPSSGTGTFLLGSPVTFTPTSIALNVLVTGLWTLTLGTTSGGFISITYSLQRLINGGSSTLVGPITVTFTSDATNARSFAIPVSYVDTNSGAGFTPPNAITYQVSALVNSNTVANAGSFGPVTLAIIPLGVPSS